MAKTDALIHALQENLYATGYPQPLRPPLGHALLQADKAAAAPLIDDAAVFVHMGATLDKTQELDAIGSLIRLKKLDVEEQSVRLIGTTAILLNKIRLTAVVNGETVTNPVVTETWGQQDTAWRLAAMAYTRIIY